MNLYEPEQILLGLKHAIKAASPKIPTPMCGDRWVITSALQKSIRRGEFSRAERAATALWQLDRNKFYTRMVVIALEDVGAASPDVVIKVLTAIVATQWRKRTGDLHIGLHLVRLLCGAVKTRLADAVCILAERGTKHQDMRQCFAQLADETLAGYVADTDAPLITRALAAWYLAGTRRFPSDTMPARIGSADKIIAALRASNNRTALTEACVSVINRIPYPLSIFTPLIMGEIERQQYTHICRAPIAAMPEVGGLPHYAADCFTRIGKSCFRELKQSVPALKPFTAQHIGLGIFYIEGYIVNHLLTSPGLAAIQQAGEEADFEGAGLVAMASQELKHILRDHMDTLTAIRQTQLEQHLASLQLGGQK